MKKLTYLLIFGILAGMIFFASCGDNGDDEPELTPQQERAQLLSGTWDQQTSSQIPEGVDPTILDELAITFNVDANFNPTSFNASGANDFFNTTSSSSWAFSGSSVDAIVLTDVTPVTSITVVSVTESLLTISFTFTSAGGRVAGLDGSYTVELVK